MYEELFRAIKPARAAACIGRVEMFNWSRPDGDYGKFKTALFLRKRWTTVRRCTIEFTSDSRHPNEPRPRAAVKIVNPTPASSPGHLPDARAGPNGAAPEYDKSNIMQSE